MKNPKKTSVRVIATCDGGLWRYVVISADEHTTRKLREGVLDDGPVTAFTAECSGPAMLDISLEDEEVTGVRAIEL